ncbi:MAG: hypothetical protein A2042_09600 [Candidatus Schekmanbacteria bacterium GWA2_38_11]|uniref:Uncharacterized protein n=1 Tax=Candidatus Schekmanbacteria bacterium GWA2_38_11 TaxID=1817876 RepID=A0A1F7RMJ0_9BACT|nr:MAG: hypothetical protein A2042_09600 [Candidatus Schekmanbacteria bacterium GWA2_38_11]
MRRKIKFEWEVPEEVFKEKLWKDEKEAVREIKRSTILDLVRRHKISLRRGAELLGITYRKFLDLMGEHRIPVFDYEKGWLDKELKNFPAFHEK